MPTTPLPSGDVWVQFPLVAVIVLVLILAFSGAFAFTKWIWGEYKKERDKDLAWRETQNAKREAATADQNLLWRQAMLERDNRYEQYDRERQGTLNKIASSMEGVIKQIADHDQQAKDIFRVTKRIDENTRPLPGTPGYERRHVEGD